MKTHVPTSNAISKSGQKICRTAEEFRTQYSLEDRRRQSAQIMNRYPDRIPIICDAFVPNLHPVRGFGLGRGKGGETTPQIDKIKYLVPANLTMGEFLFIIRKRLSISAEDALFVLINNSVIKPQSLISDVFSKHKHEDGFLYVKYTCEATFGGVGGAAPKKKLIRSGVLGK